ncbi:MAG: hypothetical protein GVY13_08545 [Alphaproteobacteria bacterium]|jgi:predicted transposase/invertase (TIGR01784 family)|nr:hypothetical protein [Alphaproteobacteria bacterium]
MPASNNPHDALFRCLLENPEDAGALIREQLPPDIAAALSGRPPVLTDATFIDPHLRETRADRLYELELMNGTPALLYILLEHKSTPDAETPLQLLGYMVRIWQRYVDSGLAGGGSLPAIVPLVIYHGRKPWRVPLSVFDCIAGADPWKEQLRDFRYIVRDLGRIDDASLSRRPIVRAVLLALKYAMAEKAPREIIAEIVASLPEGSILEIQSLIYIVRTFSQLDRETLIDIVREARPGRRDDMVSLAAQEWLQEGLEKGIKQGRQQGLEQGLEQGIEQGREQGKSLGEVQGLAESIVEILTTRFGRVDPALEARLAELPSETLRQLVKRALTIPEPDSLLDTPSP